MKARTAGGHADSAMCKKMNRLNPDDEAEEVSLDDTDFQSLRATVTA